MTASTPTSSTEGERGQGYGRGACVRVCCGPNAGMSLIYYHLRGWWCSGSVMWCCCCRSAAGSSRLRCASLFWNSCRLKEVAARGGGPLRLRGTWHGLGRYSLVPCTTGCLKYISAPRSWFCAPLHNHHHPHLIRADTTPAPHTSHLVLLLKVSPTHHPSFNTLDIIYYDTRVPRAYMIPKSHTWNSFTSKCE